MPKRIQRKRTKGWRMPEGAVYVGRPTRWGNWYVITSASKSRHGRYELSDAPIVVSVDKHGLERGPRFGGFADRLAATTFAVDLYARSLDGTFLDVDGPLNRDFYLRGLKGHDLACWCALDAPCHADVLLELANT